MSDIVFTDEMAKEYTILIPAMCPIHFELIKSALSEFYHVELLKNEGRSVIDEGLRNVHNDTCYPALLVIGQMIDALKSGQYDTHKVALIITQTGGGCRASNYVYLLRKALDKAGFEYVPIIPLNIADLKSQSGFRLSIPMVNKILSAVLYGDLLMDLNNQTKAHELNKGDAQRNTQYWISRISNDFNNSKPYDLKNLEGTMIEIVKSYDSIKRDHKEKIKVGIVGEIYIKYSPLGNNHLEDFLYDEGCEVKLGGLLGFILYCIYNTLEDKHLYGIPKMKYMLYKSAYKYLTNKEELMRKCVRENSNFEVFEPFDEVIKKAEKVIGLGVKMGEGWLLCGEIMDLIDSGYKNVICAQPFGCLPNHIVAKGMTHKIRELEKDANLVAIDYDPGASRVNQENRIKLMLAIAKENINKDVQGEI